MQTNQFGARTTSAPSASAQPPERTPAAPSAKGEGETPAASPRRLGRGLSALIGPAVPVHAGAPAPAAPAAHVRAVGEQSPGDARRTVPLNAPASVPARDDLAPESARGASGHEPRADRLLSLALDDIAPSPHQPRKSFEPGAIDELSASIRSAGVIQPIVVRIGRTAASSGGASIESRADTGTVQDRAAPRYELVAGERRWRAARKAGLERVPAVLVYITDEQAGEWALIENLQRADLSAMERAEALKSLSEKFRLTHAELAKRVGLDRSSVTNLIRLTELEESLRLMLQDGRLTLGHGKALLALQPGPAREHLGTRAQREGWSVRKLEAAASHVLGRSSASTGQPAASVDSSQAPLPDIKLRAVADHAALRDLERQLGEHLGTRVRVRADKSRKRGSLTISFYDLDHFDGLMSKMGFVMK